MSTTPLYLAYQEVIFDGETWHKQWVCTSPADLVNGVAGLVGDLEHVCIFGRLGDMTEIRTSPGVILSFKEEWGGGSGKPSPV